MSSTEMKSYLSLIPISAKVRRRQNRMTILCIVIAVFLVTAVFSMADMAIRMETSNQLNKNGNWHIMVKDISPETAAELAAQEDVAAFSAYSDINASLTENYFAGDKRKMSKLSAPLMLSMKFSTNLSGNAVQHCPGGWRSARDSKHPGLAGCYGRYSDSAVAPEWTDYFAYCRRFQ
jgi:hypothetical protein